MSEGFADRLVPEVRGYATPVFALADDLSRLVQVERAVAPEATVLYAARILEVLTAQALGAVHLGADTNPFGSLELLQQYNLMPTTTRYWAHGLRRLGNEVRHIRRRIALSDAQLAGALIERILNWFFMSFGHGHRLAALTTDRTPLGLSSDSNLAALLISLDQPDPGWPRLAERLLTGQSDGWLKTPLLPAVLAEALLEREEHAQARQVLEQALTPFPDDVRLRQLMGLHYSRTGHLDRALHWLEPLHDQYPDDDETTGILAGTYKRRWQAHATQIDLLEKAQRLYRRGWEQSKKKNAYLGINAATTALWLGRADEARTLAATIRDLLTARVRKLAEFGSKQRLALNYWDQATLAEAHLVLGELDRARELYRAAFAGNPAQRQDIQVSKAQALKTLAVRPGSSPLGEEWFS